MYTAPRTFNSAGDGGPVLAEPVHPFEVEWHPFDKLPSASLGTGRAGAHLVEQLLGSLCYAGSRNSHLLKRRNGDTIYSGYLCRRDP